MTSNKSCPICKEEIISDASKIKSCALCGMIVDYQNMILVSQDGDEDYFCLHGCYEKYSSINRVGEIIK